ncbi:hypothetical protein S40288_02103 [Stachybotrys chartarum IBT 40288]|nr:hypothetical protein S40288_02103 [Stachybotrys chartarum IBT 40288]
MNRDIPGYYYDADKKKYFKIEKATTAPAGAAWASDTVQRRAEQDRAEAQAQQRARRLRHNIKRSIFQRHDAGAGLLSREVEAGRRAERGRGRPDDRDVGAALWAAGVVDKGRVGFGPTVVRRRREVNHMPCFYVNGDDDKTGYGVGYVSLDGINVVGTYIPTDDNGRIHFSADSEATMPMDYTTEMIHCPEMSSIKYHQPSHKILLTSRQPDHSCGLYFFSPPLSSPDEDRPLWLLGETNHYQRLSIRHRLHDQWLVHKCTPAPASSDLLCVIGTNAGILRVRSNETMAWIAPEVPQRQQQQSHQSSTKYITPSPKEIFDLDFQHGNHNVVLAGGRQPHLWITDMRAPEAEWSRIPHSSSVAHLRSVNEHHVLVAGLKNAMDLYDMRFFAQRPNGARPLLRFPDYGNLAHYETGWDVCPELNVVANAQDDGTVKLFSLRSGRALRSPYIDEIDMSTPIRAMMFQRLPGEKLPSLFVGEGMDLRKFSFGTFGPEDEA